MEFQWVLEKACRNYRINKKEVNFLEVIKKKSCRFPIGLGCLLLEFIRGVAQICGISKGESLFSKRKVTNL